MPSSEIPLEMSSAIQQLQVDLESELLQLVFGTDGAASIAERLKTLDSIQWKMLYEEVQREHTRRQQGDTAGLQVGDLVQFNNKVSPRYLVGTRATVTKINSKSVVVKLPVDADPRALERFGRGTIRCPRILVDPVAP